MFSVFVGCFGCLVVVWFLFVYLFDLGFINEFELLVGVLDVLWIVLMLFFVWFWVFCCSNLCWFVWVFCGGLFWWCFCFDSVVYIVSFILGWFSVLILVVWFVRYLFACC